MDYRSFNLAEFNWSNYKFLGSILDARNILAYTNAYRILICGRIFTIQASIGRERERKEEGEGGKEERMRKGD